MKDDQWPKDKSFKENINKIWTTNYGDRRQEIVFIGLKNQMDINFIKDKLDEFLIKDYSINLENSLKISKIHLSEWSSGQTIQVLSN